MWRNRIERTQGRPPRLRVNAAGSGLNLRGLLLVCSWGIVICVQFFELVESVGFSLEVFEVCPGCGLDVIADGSRVSHVPLEPGFKLGNFYRRIGSDEGGPVLR